MMRVSSFVFIACLFNLPLSFTSTLRKTINRRTAVVESCEDIDENCSTWKVDGFCDEHADTMSYYCPLSCGICSSSSSDPVEDWSDDPSTEENNDGSSEDSGNCQAEVANGQLFNLKPSEYGYVECDDGFTRTGSYYIYCDANGGVDVDSLPSCNMGCGDISVDNAEVQPPESEEGGWLYITCHEGFSISGDAWAWCSRGNVDNLPSCEGGSSESVDDSDDDYNWETTDDIEYDSENVDDDAESFEEPDSAGNYNGCALEPVQNGEWTDPYDSLTYWILQCNDGYTKSGGDEYVYCNDDKSVSGIAGECQESQCDIQVDNGVVLSSESGGWFWIQLTCKDGYTLSGEAGVYCNSHDGSLTSPLGTCEG